MKTIKCFLCAVFFVLPVLVSAQDLAPVVADVNKAKEVAELIQVRSRLERLVTALPEDWLAVYYMGYVDVQLSFRAPSKDEKLKYLNEADTYLNKMSGFKEIDKSEFLTLKGFRLYGLIATNPQINGPKYYGEIISDYDAALGINPNNPRAIILSALFKNNMAKFMHQKYENFQKDIDKASALFSSENSALITPTWGKYWVEYALANK